MPDHGSWRPNTIIPRWGFHAAGQFIEVPRLPLERAGLSAPCTVMIGTTKRHIIIEPIAGHVLTEPYPVQTWWQVGFQRAGLGGTASGATPEIATREAQAMVRAMIDQDDRRA